LENRGAAETPILSIRCSDFDAEKIHADDFLFFQSLPEPCMRTANGQTDFSEEVMISEIRFFNRSVPNGTF